MVLSDKNTYQQVLGGLMKNPLLLVDNDIRKEDFDLRIAKIVFTTIQQLFENGAESLTPFEIDTEIEKHEGTYSLYKQDGGLEYVQNCYEYSASENFKVYYERLKKFSLLRILKKNNYDISRYYGENLTIREENEAIQNLDDDSVEEILDNVEAKFTEIRSNFIMGEKKDGDISFGLREMIEGFSNTPDIGPAINGSIFNTAIRGARPGIFLLRSCATNVGKAIPNYTIIPMADGTWKKVEDVKVGDKLIGSDGNPTTVLAVHPQKDKKKVWRIYFKDGRVAECCEEHLWTYLNNNELLTSPLKDIYKNFNKQIYIPILERGYKIFISIEKIEETDRYEWMTCFTVDAPDALFCINDYILTHNTRLAVFDSVKLCFPVRWSFERGTFIREVEKDGEPREPRKTLFITTEMDEDEIKTILVANIAGVNEEHILTATYDLGERERVSKAMDIIEEYKDYYFITKIGDPNLLNVSATIKKFVKVKGVDYVFFDYIFTSPSLISQFSAAKIREDVALGMMSNELKQIAADNHIFIASSTQVNAKGMEEDTFKDESCIRGARSVADKIDIGCVSTRLNEADVDKIKPVLRDVGVTRIPTHYTDIYKCRRGRYKGIRIWSYIDLGTGEREDLFATTPESKPIIIPTQFESAVEVPIDWR